MTEDQISEENQRLIRRVTRGLKDYIPTPEELADIRKEESETNRQFTEQAQSKEKILVTAEQLFAIFTSSEFQKRVLAYMNAKVPDPEELKIARAVAYIFDAEPVVHETPEQVFTVNRYYDRPDTEYSEEKTGSDTAVAGLSVAAIQRPDLFELILMHHEPYHQDLLKKYYPMLSIVDIGLRGDLTVLSESRMFCRKEYGVDVRNIMAGLQGGNGFGRLVIIQEADEPHTNQELVVLDRKVADLIKLHPKIKKEKLIQTLTDSGYNMWVSPITQGNLTIPTPEELAKFAFTPENWQPAT